MEKRKWRWIDLERDSTAKIFIASEPIAKSISRGEVPSTLLSWDVPFPYITLGRHEDVDIMLDTDEAQRRGIMLTRRTHAGGGCIFFEHAYAFGWAVNAEEAPTLDDNVAKQKLILEYAIRDVGISDAEVVGSGDLRWHGKKLGSTSLEKIGNVFVLIGGPFFALKKGRGVEDFLKSQKIPQEKMKDKEIKDLSEYIGFLFDILAPEEPAYGKCCEVIVKATAQAFDAEVIKGSFTERELREVIELAELQRTERWLHRKDSGRFRQHNIGRGYRVGFATTKYKKLVRIGVAIDSSTNELKDVMVAGDMYISPPSAVDEIEEALKGLNARDEGELFRKVKGVVNRTTVEQAEIHKITSQEFMLVLKQAIDEALRL